MRYLSQRFTAPNRMVAAVLNDVGTEELGTFGNRVHHCPSTDKGSFYGEIREAADLGRIILTTRWESGQAAGGCACEFQSKGDPIADLFEDLAAEQKARSTCDNILG